MDVKLNPCREFVFNPHPQIQPRHGNQHHPDQVRHQQRQQHRDREGRKGQKTNSGKALVRSNTFIVNPNPQPIGTLKKDDHGNYYISPTIENGLVGGDQFRRPAYGPPPYRYPPTPTFNQLKMDQNNNDIINNGHNTMPINRLNAYKMLAKAASTQTLPLMDSKGTITSDEDLLVDPDSIDIYAPDLKSGGTKVIFM